jgi:hypothetical protein
VFQPFEHVNRHMRIQVLTHKQQRNQRHSSQPARHWFYFSNDIVGQSGFKQLPKQLQQRHQRESQQV